MSFFSLSRAVLGSSSHRASSCSCPVTWGPVRWGWDSEVPSLALSLLCYSPCSRVLFPCWPRSSTACPWLPVGASPRLRCPARSRTASYLSVSPLPNVGAELVRHLLLVPIAAPGLQSGSDQLSHWQEALAPPEPLSCPSYVGAPVPTSRGEQKPPLRQQAHADHPL